MTEHMFAQFENSTNVNSIVFFTSTLYIKFKFNIQFYKSFKIIIYNCACKCSWIQLSFSISLQIRSHCFCAESLLIVGVFHFYFSQQIFIFFFLQFNLTLDNATQPHQCNLSFQSAFFHELAYVGYIPLSNFTILMYSNILSSLLFLSFHKNKCVIIYAYYAYSYYMKRMKLRAYNNAPKSQEIKCTIL